MEEAMRKDPHFFTVEGAGEFPFDMLRYDACWPRDEGLDSYKLSGFEHGLRRIVLVTHREIAPTVGRWESFGWRVIGIGNLRDTEQYPTPARRSA
jgi:hypothetical protein